MKYKPFQDEKDKQFEKWSNHGKSFVPNPACHEINPLTRLESELVGEHNTPSGSKPFFIRRLFHDDDTELDENSHFQKFA